MADEATGGGAGGVRGGWQQLLAIGKRVLASDEIRRTLSLALDGLIELAGAERGMVVLFDEGGEAVFDEARNLDREDIAQPEFEVSRTIVETVRREGRPFWSMNALEDGALGIRGSVMRLQILSVICLPILHDGKPLGVVYLDHRGAAGVFQPQTRDLAESRHRCPRAPPGVAVPEPRPPPGVAPGPPGPPPGRTSRR